MMAVGSTINFILSIFGIFVSSIFIIFWCARLLCYQILNGSRSRGPLLSRITFNGRVVERTMSGVSPLVISTFPTVNFNQNVLASKQESLCAICLAEYREGELLRFLPECIHMFHANCIDAWLQEHSTCPVCRMPIQDVPPSVSQSGTDETVLSEQVTGLSVMSHSRSDFDCEGEGVENLTNLVHSIGHNVPAQSPDTVSASQLRMEELSSFEHLNSHPSVIRPAVINCTNKRGGYVNLHATLAGDEHKRLALQLEKHAILQDFADASGINRKESHFMDLEPPE